MKKGIYILGLLLGIAWPYNSQADFSLFCPSPEFVQKIADSKKDTSQPIPFQYEGYKAILNLEGNIFRPDMKLLRVILHKGTGVVWCNYGKNFQTPPLEGEVGVEIHLGTGRCSIKEVETGYTEDFLISEIDPPHRSPKEVKIICRTGSS